ncbi:MAG: low specificity L-threonine aldolase, partial [Eubacterium sp.]|nr:low specificity L-threonine aldolase [Eubacterium sp.]
GVLLAKGRLLGIQFDALFTADLYYEIGRHGIAMAEELKEIFHEKGYEFFLESPTNQQFVILSEDKKKELEKQVQFSVWEKLEDGRMVVRFATSWSTTKEDLEVVRDLL